MKEYLEYLISPLLSQPDALVIESSGSVVNITVAKEDMGRIIGKHGLIISAIRNLVKVFTSMHSIPQSSINLVEA